jgi:hypothetical protein
VNILITVCHLLFFFWVWANGMQNTFLVFRPEEKNVTNSFPLILVKNFELSFSFFNCNRLTITHHSPTYPVRYGAIVFLQILCVESVDTSTGTGTNMYYLHTSECSSLAYMTLTGKSPAPLMLKVYGDVEC